MPPRDYSRPPTSHDPMRLFSPQPPEQPLSSSEDPLAYISVTRNTNSSPRLAKRSFACASSLTFLLRVAVQALRRRSATSAPPTPTGSLHMSVAPVKISSVSVNFSQKRARRFASRHVLHVSQTGMPIQDIQEAKCTAAAHYMENRSVLYTVQVDFKYNPGVFQTACGYKPFHRHRNSKVTHYSSNLFFIISSEKAWY